MCRNDPSKEFGGAPLAELSRPGILPGIKVDRARALLASRETVPRLEVCADHLRSTMAWSPVSPGGRSSIYGSLPAPLALLQMRMRWRGTLRVSKQELI
jgi:hypothetical protein